MGWREERIAHYKEQITQLEHDIAAMEAGKILTVQAGGWQPAGRHHPRDH